VQLEVNLETGFTGDHEHGLNTLAEIPGTDPSVKDEVVMLGAHLDSWAAGTGATDNGAGTVVAMEVMRILNAIHFRPRRTVRVALWTGEEEGELGSYGYVKHHLAFVPRSTAAEQMKLTEYDRDPAGPIQLFPEYYKVSAYFNLDHGGGKIRGIWLQKNIAVASIFAQWIEPLKDLGVTTLSMRETGGTDNDAFDEVGIPGFQFIQDPLDYWSRAHHSNMDLYERLVPEDLAQAAVVEATFVYNAAMRDLMLPRKPFPHPELDEEHSKPLKSVMPGAPANVR
jgi:Zn-dependent M28 family amino/carboxypeptidase